MLYHIRQATLSTLTLLQVLKCPKVPTPKCCMVCPLRVLEVCRVLLESIRGETLSTAPLICLL